MPEFRSEIAAAPKSLAARATPIVLAVLGLTPVCMIAGSGLGGLVGWASFLLLDALLPGIFPRNGATDWEAMWGMGGAFVGAAATLFWLGRCAWKDFLRSRVRG